MPEFDRLAGSSIGIELYFVEREQTPREPMLLIGIIVATQRSRWPID